MSLRTQFAADVKAVCMNPEDFAVAAVFRVSGATAETAINGIFKTDFKDAALYRSATDIGTTVFICASADLVSTAKTGDEIEIDDDVFYIVRVNRNTLSGKAIVSLSENNPKT